MLEFYKKLWEILKEVERIEKDKHNQQGGYKYASEAAIKERFHPIFAQHGIVLQPTSITDMLLIPPSGDKKSYITTFVQHFALLDLESGHSLPIVVYASGGDTLDKGAWKALTGAIKYALTTLFLIPTGDDPENDGSAKERTRPRAAAIDPESVITPAQLKRFHTIVAAYKIDQAHAVDVLKGFGYASSKDVKAKDYDAIVKQLEGVQ